ncbi:MAG TPA: cytochrome ubiquinol oxidase subunit I [Trebonia sp.]|nr:cytochrome ubiquinol oxidase subunit I [Trebonia sp.]
MNTLTFARLEFGVTAGIHFMIVGLSLGLALLLSIIETRWVRNGDPRLESMAKFWGGIFVINFAVGIFTGLVMEFQFGLNWSGLTHFLGDVFGAPLALETIIAFFAESTFLGMWIFGWGQLGQRVHLALIWLVTLAAYASVFFILADNAFLQHPVGYAVSGGVGRLTDFGAVLTNGNLLLAFGHVVGAGLMVGGTLMAGVSAYHLRRPGGDTAVFRSSLRTGVLAMLVGFPVLVAFGIEQFGYLGDHQPDALRALFKALIETIGAFTMLVLGGLLILLTLASTVMLVKDRLMRSPALQRLLVWAIPLPFLTSVGGWVFREEGRQPWAVYNVLPTRAALGNASFSLVASCFVVFTVVLVVLVIIDYALIAKMAKRGPADGIFGTRVDELLADEPEFTL